MIVDPQIDFISGSLKVEGAKEKMDALADSSGPTGNTSAS